MYPATELTELARCKTLLRRRIAVTRLECVALASAAARPVHWLDRFLAQWRRISPVTKLAWLPVLLLFRRRLFHRRGAGYTGLLSWLPLILRGVRTYRARKAAASAFAR